MPKPRARDYQRIYKACDSCRTKKTRCIAETSDGVTGTSCKKCRRESRECSLSTLSTRKLQYNVSAADSSKSITAPATSGPQSDPGSSAHSHQDGLSNGRATRTSLYDHADPGLSEPLIDIAAAEDQSPIQQRYEQASLQDAVMRTLISGNEDTVRLLAQSGGPQNYQTVPSSLQSCPSPPALEANGEFLNTPVWPIKIDYPQPDPEILRLWQSFRFVRMGWLTAAEAVAYVDLFFQNQACLSPVADNFYSDHRNHYELITQEPLLCCTILTVSCRSHLLHGGGGVSRSVYLHQRLWEHCQHLVTRILFGQEKMSKAKTRTFRAIQALLILAEWCPRGIHFPPQTDGWDSDLIFQVPDERDELGGNRASDLSARWFRQVVVPTKLMDRMSWMLLGCAMSLSHELGVFQAAVTGASHPHPVVERKCGGLIGSSWMRKLLYVADEQLSGRLQCTSQVPVSLSMTVSPRVSVDEPDEIGNDLQRKDDWYDLAIISRSISDTVFSTTTVTRGLIQSNAYIGTINHFQQMLAKWRQSNPGNPENKESLDAPSEMLTIEYNFTWIRLHSLGVQAVVERAFGSSTRAATPMTSRDSNAAQPFITPIDYGFIQRVIDGSCQVLQSVSRLSAVQQLRYCPVRVLLRVMAASIFLLKALSVGGPTARFEECVSILQSGIDALRQSTWDDMDLAARYAALLDLHLAHVRRRFTAGKAPEGMPIHDAGRAGPPVACLGQELETYSSIGSFEGVDWLSYPFDVSMAPFGVTDDQSAEILGLDEGDWSFVWGLPLA